MHLFICFGLWTTVISLIIWRTGTTAKQAVNHVQRLHQIPCSNCTYFTGDYRLKCTVHPCKALSEDAIDCRDFEVCSSRNCNFAQLNRRKK